MSDLRRCGFVLLAYAAVAVGMTWPLAAKCATHLVGESWDTLVHYWNAWWVKQALTMGCSPFYTRYLFYPTGMALVYQNFAWLNIVAWLVLEPWVGGLAAYNVSVLASLALCGFTAFLLARELTDDRSAAFLAGLIYQCWPARLYELGHPNLISTQWIPLLLLFMVRTVRRGRWQDSVLAGVFLALTGYTRWQQLIPATIVGGIYLVCTLPIRQALSRRYILTLALAGAVVALALAPPALLLLSEQRKTPAGLLVEEDETSKQTDLLTYLTPTDVHPLLGPWTLPAYERYYPDRSRGHFLVAYVGVTILALVLVGAWKARRAALPWLAMALVLLLLALGPVLQVGGRLYPALPMLYRLAARLFVVRLIRVPARFNMFLALPIATLAGYGLSQVLGLVRRWGRCVTVAASLLLGAMILFEYLVVPVPVERYRLSPFYDRLAAEPGNSAVLNLPMGHQISKIYMFAQVTHHHPILQGKTARLPEGAYAYLDGDPWLRGLRRSGEMSPGLADVSRQLGSLAADDVEYIIVHKTRVGADQVARWRRYLLTVPRYEDDQIAVYTTTPLAGRDFTLAEELAPGIGFIRVITSTGCVNPGGVLEVDVGWGTTAAPKRDLYAELALTSERDAISQTESFSVSPGWPVREWPASAVVWGYYAFQVHPSLPSGTYTLTLRLKDPTTGVLEVQPAVLGRVALSRSICAFSAPAGAISVNALFGTDLRLLGYELDRDGAYLRVTLYWRSERRMETDYKIFVHVFDPETTVPVAQDDSMPHRWAYPTTFWGPGEAVDDPIPISLEGVPAGVYGVAVGVYDPVTLERLPVVDATGQLQPDGRLVLPGETIRVEGLSP